MIKFEYLFNEQSMNMVWFYFVGILYLFLKALPLTLSLKKPAHISGVIFLLAFFKSFSNSENLLARWVTAAGDLVYAVRTWDLRKLFAGSHGLNSFPYGGRKTNLQFLSWINFLACGLKCWIVGFLQRPDFPNRS